MDESIIGGLRREAGISQEALALKSGVSQSAVSQFEQLRRPLSSESATKLAGALGVDDPARLRIGQALALVSKSVDSLDTAARYQKAGQLVELRDSLAEDDALRGAADSVIEELVGSTARKSEDPDDELEAEDDRGFFGERSDSYLKRSKGSACESLDDDGDRGFFGERSDADLRL